MHLTLHLTNKCNLNCEYCFVQHGNESMTREVAFAAVKFGMEDKKSSGLLFYGGEPLLEKQLIYDIAEHSIDIKEKTGHIFYYKTTTNGTLLDEEFLKFSRDINMTLGFSHDGTVQDDCRSFSTGGGTFDILEEKIPLVLKYQPYAVGMSVMAPSTVHNATKTIKFLFEKGFRYITMSLNYDINAPWTKKHFAVLEEEYKKMAEMYITWTKAEEKFYLAPFEMKILSHLKGEKYHADRHKLAHNQLSVAPDGKIFHSSKYVGFPEFTIGDVFSGIDLEKQEMIEKKALTPPEPCQECALRPRCNYAYGHLKLQSGNIVLENPSPIQCAHEQLIVPIADYVAEKLYKERNALFIHKHYNASYPVASLVEDKGLYL